MNGSPFAIQYWTLDGETQHNLTLLEPADAKRSVVTDTVNFTTFMIEESLPVLAEFLCGMNDGFVGEGGYILGDLYVEHSMLKL